ncbi:hypothetical protein C8Q74DRAFT_217067 [Fomes fomentarius]|nr:hypothetical protein C8Q74DRAFT_217067 [Fomes fomentarius]
MLVKIGLGFRPNPTGVSSARTFIITRHMQQLAPGYTGYWIIRRSVHRDSDELEDHRYILHYRFANLPVHEPSSYRTTLPPIYLVATGSDPTVDSESSTPSTTIYCLMVATEDKSEESRSPNEIMKLLDQAGIT